MAARACHHHHLGPTKWLARLASCTIWRVGVELVPIPMFFCSRLNDKDAWRLPGGGWLGALPSI